MAVPVGVWLGGIVIVSTGVWIAVGRANAAPWIMIDEIVYSELAKSFAAHGHFLVRGVPSNGYGFVYPVADRAGLAALRGDPRRLPGRQGDRLGA